MKLNIKICKMKLKENNMVVDRNICDVILSIVLVVMIKKKMILNKIKILLQNMKLLSKYNRNY